ncbi:MAG TPA: glycosyltransferase [Gammaproteobacteria bacterium]|nr:glycosyltransferase [Gammaproteobacteria bacterium]
MQQPKVTILIPNYKTLDLTKLCLRLLRKYTTADLAKVVVIDNDSQDASVEYLRSLSWITLIERPKVAGESPVLSHARALDLGMQQANTPYVLSIHTDTLVKHPQWLEFLIHQIEKNPNTAGVGSWKLESKPWLKRFFKVCERGLQKFYRTICSKDERAEENYHYLRSHCALYRMDLIHQHQLAFADNEQVAGKGMHKKLVDLGYQMIFLTSEVLGQYLDHINHATTLLNPEFKDTIRRNRDKELKKLEKRLHSIGAEKILAADSLDA